VFCLCSDVCLCLFLCFCVRVVMCVCVCVYVLRFLFLGMVDDQEIWRGVTASMAHMDFLHLAFNMTSLWSCNIMEQIVSIETHAPVYCICIYIYACVLIFVFVIVVIISSCSGIFIILFLLLYSIF